MNPTREELLFGLALTKPVDERAKFLERECRTDPALRQRLKSLLAAHEQPATELGEAGEATVKATAVTEPLDEAVGQTLGRYKLLERVGEGGCGVVYVAEQTEPVRRRVALKVIKLAWTPSRWSPGSRRNGRRWMREWWERSQKIRAERHPPQNF